MTPRLQDTSIARAFSTGAQVIAAVGITALALLAAGPSRSEEKASEDKAAASGASDPSVLRVCAAAKELPYSAEDKSGFENKIAEILADGLGRKVQFVWSKKPAIYAVRDQLYKNLCDIVIGTDTGDDRVLTSKPYYRAAYVFIQRKDSPLRIENWDSSDLQKAHPIGFVQGTPADVMMNKVDLFNDNVSYAASLTNFQDRRNVFTRVPPDRMVNEVGDKTAALAVGFAPEVARYVKSNDALKMIVVPDNNVRSDGERVPFHFDQSFAVRKDDKDLMTAINAALPKVQSKIEAVLKDEGIPFEAPVPPT